MSKFLPRKLFSNIIFYIMLISFWFFSYVLAQSPNAFIVEVQPSSFEVNQAVDIVIKAVNNWEIIKTYNWDVFIEVEWDIDPQNEYVVPSEGLYTFVPQDQWIKVFSKWLLIKKAWTFKLKISDITDESIKWEATIIVGKPWWTDIEKIQITSPVAWVTERNSVVNAFWISSNLPNSPILYYLNDLLVQQWITDNVWNFNTYLTWVKQWQNILRVKIVDSQNSVIWESDQISFNYQPITDETFQWIEILPVSNIKQWDRVIFNVKTKESISSVTLKLNNNKTYPMDVVTVWQFSKTINMELEWDIKVWLDIMDQWNKKTYEDIQILTVSKWTVIRNVKFFTDLTDQSLLTVKWEVVWLYPTKFKIEYWLANNLLNNSVNVDTNELIIENINQNLPYYFKITPLNPDLTPIWTSSEIIKYDPSWPTCTVQNILILDEKIWDKYYLTWTGVENVDKYVIYRSEFETSDLSQMKKVWETTGARFEYPFNKFSKTDEYAFYVVQAICKDGTELKIDNVKKVQVWPVENMLVILVFSIFFYSVYRLYQYWK